MPDALRRAISDDEISAFHRDGAVLLKGVLHEHWVEVAATGLDAAIAEADQMSANLDKLRVDQFPAARSPHLRQLIHESPLAEIVGTVLNSPVSFYMDQLFHKPAGLVPPTAWHQDTSYYNADGDNLIRAWVSPDAVPRNRSMEVVRGSHRWNVTYRPLAGRSTKDSKRAATMVENASPDTPMLGRQAYDDWSYFSGVADESLPPVPDINANRDSFEIIGWDYEPGDVLLFSGHILHSALGGVISESQRRAHASLWAGRDVRYVHRIGQIIPDPIGLYDHSPTTGQPLADFPDVFPTLWSPKSRSG